MEKVYMEKAITNLYAFVGGYMGPSYEVSIDFADKSVKHIVLNRYIVEQEKVVSLSQENMDIFIQVLKDVDIFNWKAYYQPDGFFCDGTSWTVIVCTDEGDYEFSGENAYPEKWEQFCSGIKEITGEEFS